MQRTCSMGLHMQISFEELITFLSVSSFNTPINIYTDYICKSEINIFVSYINESIFAEKLTYSSFRHMVTFSTMGWHEDLKKFDKEKKPAFEYATSLLGGPESLSPECIVIPRTTIINADLAKFLNSRSICTKDLIIINS